MVLFLSTHISLRNTVVQREQSLHSWKRNISLNAVKTAEVSSHQERCVLIFFLLLNNGQRQNLLKEGSGDLSAPLNLRPHKRPSRSPGMTTVLNLEPEHIPNKVPLRTLSKWEGGNDLPPSCLSSWLPVVLRETRSGDFCRCTFQDKCPLLSVHILSFSQ